MPTNPFVDELRRIRADFESQASNYHDVTLTVHYLENQLTPSELIFPRPHHAINLWQIISTSPDALEKFDIAGLTRFGFAKAELTALAVVARRGNQSLCKDSASGSEYYSSRGPDSGE